MGCVLGEEWSGNQHERDTSTEECERSLRLNNNGQKIWYKLKSIMKEIFNNSFLKFSEIYETSDPLLTFMAFMIYSACLPPNILYQKTNKYIHIYIYIYISKHLLFQLCCVSIRIKPFSSELITQYGGTWPKTLQVHTQL